MLSQPFRSTPSLSSGFKTIWTNGMLYLKWSHQDWNPQKRFPPPKLRILGISRRFLPGSPNNSRNFPIADGPVLWRVKSVRILRLGQGEMRSSKADWNLISHQMTALEGAAARIRAASTSTMTTISTRGKVQSIDLVRINCDSDNGRHSSSPGEWIWSPTCTPFESMVIKPK